MGKVKDEVAFTKFVAEIICVRSLKHGSLVSLFVYSLRNHEIHDVGHIALIPLLEMMALIGHKSRNIKTIILGRAS
ncbi:hypothetical protein YC2023_079146 [Brassica napus]